MTEMLTKYSVILLRESLAWLYTVITKYHEQFVCEET